MVALGRRGRDSRRKSIPDSSRTGQLDRRAGEFRARADVVAVKAVRVALFPDSVRPVGRTIRIGRVPFEVVGVLAPKGVSVDGSATEDDRIIVPL